MSDYSIKELEQWNERIERIARDAGLDYYEQEFEIVSFEDMIGYETYIGMPSHYPHWSYGKAYERTKTLNKYNLSGLPYEMVINSNPCMAYLMKDNTLLLQILTIAHVYGHNDFFKNNRMFKRGTRAEYTIEMFKNHANRIREYISDPGIGYKRVERILDAAHALKYQTVRNAEEKKSSEDEKRKYIYERYLEPKDEYSLIKPKNKNREPLPDLRKIPIEPEEDILDFLASYGRLNDWEKDIINIVREETAYFIPQIETKIMNEGWASFWHYNILQRLELNQGLYMEFLKRHNQVIKPIEGRINPYYIGFKIFDYLYRKNEENPAKIFEVREIERDQSFLRRYLTYEMCRETDLFEYERIGNEYLVTETSDEEGWEKIRNTLADSAGMGGLPVIRVIELVMKDNTIVLEHVYDGRELDINYACETLKHIADLWEGTVILSTMVDERRTTITCDESKKITTGMI